MSIAPNSGSRNESAQNFLTNIYASGCALIESGYRVLPLGNGKSPSTAGGFYASTNDPDKLREWIKAGKLRVKLGIATGAGFSDVVVIDADSPEAFQWMYERYGEAHVITDRGGHWYFKHPGDGKVTSKAISEVHPNLDRKGDGGYVEVPPSPGKNWTGDIPDRLTLQELPAEFRTQKAERVNTSEGRKLDPETFAAAVEIIAAHYPALGSQYDFGFHLSGYLQGNGLGEADTFRLMWDALERQPGGADSDAERNISRVVQTTAQRIADGENVTGGPRVETISPGLIGKLGPLLGFTISPKSFSGLGGNTTPDAPTPDGPRRTYELTDTGNGERFSDQHGRNVKWVSRWGKHLIWTGRVWSLDDREEVSRKAQTTAKSIHADASEPGAGVDAQKAISRHAISSQNGPRIRAMIDLAKPYMAASHTDFDADPWVLNCQNGTLDLRTGELREHRRADLITKVTPVEYDPDASAPTFGAFLKQIIPNEHIRGFLQRAFGMALAGEIRDNVLVILYGTGSNGKSTLVEAIMEAFGDYGIASAPDLLMSKGHSHPTELADLFGARLVSCMESEEGRRLNEGLVKQLTGRDKIKARRMREDFWEFDPTHTVFLGTNHKPEIRGTDPAIWRRLKLVPFEVTIPDAEQDKDLPTKLQGELPGILRWLAEGCLEWQRGGLQEPDEVKTATKDYRADMDVLEQFIEDCCVVHSGAQAPATPLYKRYQIWCENAGENPLKQRAFGARLGERGFESFKFTAGPHKRNKGWAGIGLLGDEQDPDDDGPGSGAP